MHQIGTGFSSFAGGASFEHCRVQWNDQGWKPELLLTSLA